MLRQEMKQTLSELNKSNEKVSSLMKEISDLKLNEQKIQSENSKLRKSLKKLEKRYQKLLLHHHISNAQKEKQSQDNEQLSKKLKKCYDKCIHLEKHIIQYLVRQREHIHFKDAFMIWKCKFLSKIVQRYKLEQKRRENTKSQFSQTENGLTMENSCQTSPSENHYGIQVSPCVEEKACQNEFLNEYYDKECQTSPDSCPKDITKPSPKKTTPVKKVRWKLKQ